VSSIAGGGWRCTAEGWQKWRGEEVPAEKSFCCEPIVGRTGWCIYEPVDVKGGRGCEVARVRPRVFAPFPGAESLGAEGGVGSCCAVLSYDVDDVG
jgi:hypothetical protein